MESETAAQESRLNKSLVEYEEDNRHNYILVVLIGSVQGLLDMGNLAYFYIYLYEQRCTPTGLALLNGLVAFPWVFKPLFGYLSDHHPCFGYHRKSYIFLVSLLEFFTHLLMFKYQFGLVPVALLQMTQVFCVGFRNVVAEALIVILTKRLILVKEANVEQEK